MAQPGLVRFWSREFARVDRTTPPPSARDSMSPPPSEARNSRPPGSSEGHGSRFPGAPEREIRVDDAGPIRDIILDKRSRKNAITLGMYASLGAAFAEAGSDDRCHVVVLRSAGGAFSLGSDLGPADDPETVSAFDSAQGEFLGMLASFEKPVVAAVSGLAVGAGAALLLHCDIVVASEFAAFEFSSAKLGRAPDALTCTLLESRIGLQRASEWLLLGERIKVDEALRLGLVNAVVPLENLHGSTRARAQALAELPPHVARETKRLLSRPDRLRARGGA